MSRGPHIPNKQDVLDFLQNIVALGLRDSIKIKELCIDSKAFDLLEIDSSFAEIDTKYCVIKVFKGD